MAIKPINFFQNPAEAGIKGINPIQKPAEQPIQAVQAISGKANPFANEEKGVGLVQSDLQNFSYALPNGKVSNCNTRWIG